jgi:hypothetical protein
VTMHADNSPGESRSCAFLRADAQGAGEGSSRHARHNIQRSQFGLLVQAAGADGYAPPERAPRLLKKLEDVCAYAGVAVCAGCQESDGPT